jgi:hypothetical protein
VTCEFSGAAVDRLLAWMAQRGGDQCLAFAVGGFVSAHKTTTADRLEKRIANMTRKEGRRF